MMDDDCCLLIAAGLGAAVAQQIGLAAIGAGSSKAVNISAPPLHTLFS